MKYRKTPSCRHHKATGRAVVTLNGKDHYLGQYGSIESRDRYDSLIAQWLASGRQTDAEPITVSALVAQYQKYAAGVYMKLGGATATIGRVNTVCNDLAKLHGREPAGRFNALHFKSLRATWVARGLALSTIGSYSRVAVDVFRWAVEERFVNVAVVQELKCIKGIRAGTVSSTERAPIRPVPDADIEAVIALAKPKIAAMIRLQLLTGMRPGELCGMRPGEINRTAEPWIYTPLDHKTAHHGKSRRIPLGAKSREILRPLLEACGPESRIFNKPCFQYRPGGWPELGRRWSARDSYARVITKLCRAAGVTRWHPHQLRHNAATRIRHEHGLETARVLLGHASVRMTEVYAETDQSKAFALAESTD